MALRQEPLLRDTAWVVRASRWLPTAIPLSRLVLVIIVAAFVLAMVWVQQTQTLVRLGGEIQRLERRLESVVLERQQVLAELAVHNDLSRVQRIAYTELEMREPRRPVFARAQPLPPGVSFDLPLWAAPTQPLAEYPWWEALTREISARISRLAE
ncbi:MAG: cell division protein FtsL [Chloroflexota bacterium]|nr:cell division protein FtsL [Chloroflexota bacterium]MDE2898638.1 cell division protein FtsL [Chloroflexota bacterium]